MRFKDKICFVTGAGSGIGKSTALAFAKEGAKLAICDINLENLNKTHLEIESLGMESLSIVLDISDSQSVEAALKETISKFSGLDCVANCAGVAGPVSKRVHEYPEHAWHQQININLTGTWYCMKYQLTHLLDHGGGTIVNLSSAAGLIGQPENSPYAASKHGIVGLTKTAAKEYATDNIRINTICPTAIETPMIMEGRRKLAHNNEARQAAINFQAMKRMGTPEEIAAIVLWLSCEESSFITGIAMAADGGALA